MELLINVVPLWINFLFWELAQPFDDKGLELKITLHLPPQHKRQLVDHLQSISHYYHLRIFLKSNHINSTPCSLTVIRLMPWLATLVALLSYRYCIQIVFYLMIICCYTSVSSSSKSCFDSWHVCCMGLLLLLVACICFSQFGLTKGFHSLH